METLINEPQKPTTKTQVATISSKDLFKDAGAGLENLAPEDLIVPQLKIAQPQSPMVNPHDAAYIEGVKVGDIVNNVTNEHYLGSEGITVVPVFYRRVFLEFVDRNLGGGLVAIHDNPSILSQTTRGEKGQDILEGGNYIQTTANHYVLVIKGEKTEPVMVAMFSTQLKKSRRWNSIMAGLRLTSENGKTFNPPSYSHLYRLSTVPQSNAKGDWYGWKVDLMGRVEDLKVYNEAKSFGNSISKEMQQSSEEKERDVIEAF